MTSEYKLRIKTPLSWTVTVAQPLTLAAEITDFLSLDYLKVVNSPGQLEFVLSGDHAAIQYLVNLAVVEVWRRNVDESIAWYRDFVGIFRDEERNYKDRKKRFHAKIPGIMSMLGWRVINWSANTTDRSVFTNKMAKYIVDKMVDYNISGNATVANSRKREGRIPYIVDIVGDNGASGIDFPCFGDVLLEAIQKVVTIGDCDFDLEFDGTDSWFDVHIYDGQLGTDRSASVQFNLLFGNMAEPTYSMDRSIEKTVACVWGKGEESAREYVTRTGDNYSLNNDVEVFVDGSQRDTAAGYNAIGDQKLKEYKATDNLEFDVLQTPASLYGKHYFLGDRITGVYDDVTKVLKITSVAIGFDGAREKISVGMDNRL